MQFTKKIQNEINYSSFIIWFCKKNLLRKKYLRIIIDNAIFLKKIKFFHKNLSNKPITTFFIINITLPIVLSIIKPINLTFK